MKRSSTAAAVVALVIGALVPSVASAQNPNNTNRLQNAVKVSDILVHERALANIAERNGGTRASGTPGFERSSEYVAGVLRDAGYEVTVQPFDFAFFTENAPATFARVSPNPRTYADTEFATMQYSGSGDVTAAIAPVDLTLPPAPEPGSTSGCEAADFAGFTPGSVALLQRGTCTFEIKATNAQAAGASAVIIFNEGQEGRTETLTGTLGNPTFTIPIIGTSFEIGNELATLAAAREVTVHITTETTSETRQTSNLIAETSGGRADRTVVVGAHLDSVTEGPGINDDGSGTATDLAVAVAMAKRTIQPVNKVRFAWWGAEESGLIGSTFYVNSLTQAQKDAIDLNLNFDMLASPNFVRFVYDGDASDNADLAPGPVGSDVIEARFRRFFAARGLPVESTPFDGRSDYQAFINSGIPAGGLFTGAEEVKTPEQAAIFGGTAGLAFDPCYHQACDDLSNLNLQVLDEMSDAVADSVGYFAQRRAPLADPSPTAQARVRTTTFSGDAAQQ
jgi:Zn-dependent M28 family amino/carboxypeptidase